MSDARLEVQELTVRYGGVTALDGITFSVGAGEVVGLIGPNGAGKTTCIDALTGFTAPSRGRVLLDGCSFDRVAPHARARRGFVRTFQSLELFDDLTVRENLVVRHPPPRGGRRSPTRSGSSDSPLPGSTRCSTWWA